MTRAEERALEAFPKDIQLFVESQEEPGKWLPVDGNLQLRYGYQRGYEQAEKDLALTWEDLELFHRLFAEEEDNFSKHDKYFYAEVLTRFKQYKEEQQ